MKRYANDPPPSPRVTIRLALVGFIIGLVMSHFHLMSIMGVELFCIPTFFWGHIVIGAVLLAGGVTAWWPRGLSWRSGLIVVFATASVYAGITWLGWPRPIANDGLFAVIANAEDLLFPVPLILTLFIAGPLFLVYHTIFIDWKRVKRLRPIYLHCLECGYDLRAQTQPRCPECGTAYRLSDLLASPKPKETTHAES